MKILIVNSLYPPDVIGGAEISTYKLACELLRRGNEVHVLTTGQTDSDEDYEGVCVHRRLFKNIESFWDFKHDKLIRRVIYKIIDYYNILNSKIIKDVIDAIGPEVLHTNNIYGITPVIWKIAKKNNIPIVHTLRDYYLICPKANLMKRSGNICKCGNFICKVFRIYYRHLSNNVEAVTAPSQYTLNQFLNVGYFKNASKEVIYNAVDYDSAEIHKKALQRKKGQIKREIHVAYVGALLETKGVQVLLEAIDEAPENFYFHFAGRGKLEKDVVSAAEKNTHIKYHGFLNEVELSALLDKVDALICPSIWPEPFGRVVIDAYKACIPVIATDSGGLPELIDNGVTGMIIEPNSKDAIVDSLKKLNEGYFTHNSIDTIEEKLTDFSIAAQGEKFYNLFSHVINENKQHL